MSTNVLLFFFSDIITVKYTDFRTSDKFIDRVNSLFQTATSTQTELFSPSFTDPDSAYLEVDITLLPFQTLVIPLKLFLACGMENDLASYGLTLVPDQTIRYIKKFKFDVFFKNTLLRFTYFLL